VAFIIVRVFTAITALAGLTGTLWVIAVTATVNMVKGGASVVAAVAADAVSGFRKGASIPTPGPLVPTPLVGLAFVFVAMFVSVFLPGQKIYLHVVAAAAVVFSTWRLWSTTHWESSVFYVPMIVVWLVYYVVCLRRA